MPGKHDRYGLTSFASPSAVVLGAVMALMSGGLADEAWSATPAEQPPIATHTVTIENLQFNPRTLSVRAGERVIWINKDLVPHTATAQSKAFDSGNIAPEASWSFIARRKGEIHYGCSFHPTMSATLIVK